MTGTSKTLADPLSSCPLAAPLLLLVVAVGAEVLFPVEAAAPDLDAPPVDEPVPIVLDPRPDDDDDVVVAVLPPPVVVGAAREVLSV